MIQVERTGADQRASGLIHADDVKDWLLTAGFDEAEIAIKTAETNDLKQPKNLDLLSPTNRVRAIITKQALQEGWDCPFAYVLCSLAASSNLNAMTQLVGRILRQPHAIKTGIAALDECHVITHKAGTGDVVKKIKDGLEKDGLGDLAISVSAGDGEQNMPVARKIPRRAEFSNRDIFLPKVLWVEGDYSRDLDYETDVLATVDWRGFDPRAIADAIPENYQPAQSQLQRISIIEGKEHFLAEALKPLTESMQFDPAYAVRMISDLVPNPFVGRDIVGGVLKRLQDRDFDKKKIGRLGGFLVEQLRLGLEKAQVEKAEALFKKLVAGGKVQFRLRADGNNWQMPDEMTTILPQNATQLPNHNGASLQKSLFSPVYSDELNKDEQGVAIYLDDQDALRWWHRNVARAHYSLQGWKRAKVYPDFVFAVKRNGDGDRLVALETKGDHLDNADTAYKRELLNLLSQNFSWSETVPAGTLQLLQKDGAIMECSLVLMSEWKAKLPKLLKPV